MDETKYLIEKWSEKECMWIDVTKRVRGFEIYDAKHYLFKYFNNQKDFLVLKSEATIYYYEKDIEYEELLYQHPIYNYDVIIKKEKVKRTIQFKMKHEEIRYFKIFFKDGGTCLVVPDFAVTIE